MKWVLDGDIKAFFDSIDHKILIGILGERIDNKRFINLCWKMLRAGYQEAPNILIKSFIGSPQGSFISPNLANKISTLTN